MTDLDLYVLRRLVSDCKRPYMGSQEHAYRFQKLVEWVEKYASLERMDSKG